MIDMAERLTPAEIHRKGWLDSRDTEVLGDSPELCEVRGAMEASYDEWSTAEARADGVAARRVELRRQVADTTITADDRQAARDALRELRADVDDLPAEIEALAAAFADAFERWARFVERAAEAVRQQADSDEKAAVGKRMPMPDMNGTRRGNHRRVDAEHAARVEAVMKDARPHIETQAQAKRLLREVHSKRRELQPAALMGTYGHRRRGFAQRAGDVARERLSGAAA